MKKKLKIGWFSFTCCEDSTMVWIELMNENFFEWKELHRDKARKGPEEEQRAEGHRRGFCRGRDNHREGTPKKLREIRKNSKKLVAIGSCAVNGMPAAQRNMFNEEMKKEIEFLIKRFKQTDKVRTVKDVVPIDDEVQGCPMEEEVFLRVLDKYLKEFGVVNA